MRVLVLLGGVCGCALLTDWGWAGRHPVTNDYMPPQFKDEVFLKPAGDLSDKTWDEEALQRWEIEENGGQPWEGRQNGPSSHDAAQSENH